MASVIFIEEHDEHISRLLPKEELSPPPTPKYVSKCADKVKREFEAYKTGKHRTFGIAEEHLVPPENYLRKSEGVKPARPTVSRHRCSAERMSIPKLEPAPPAPRKPLVNFRLRNISNVEVMKPKQKERMVVVTCKGDRKRVDGSGQVPEYSRRATFGQLPAYVKVFNCEWKRLDDARKKKVMERSEMCQLISSEQRLELLEGLKLHWGKVSTTYQRLPLIPDGRAKIKRKEGLEATLATLEKEIALIEGNPQIYVYDDGTDDAANKEGFIRRKEKGI